ncbi:venom carboxylesterase-6-like [Rhynchophorus ferrugineus]|uniref:venom carboxylesterase-6-like n=1 Tax=Rhynchophorus ferrugineus TaxID=354439 RepID=UPI003FCDC8ED
MWSIKLLLLCILLKSCTSKSPPRVGTPLGIIEGTIDTTFKNKTFFQFEGIPYAKPPIGELRFEDPQDPEKWSGVLKATVVTLCQQYHQYNVDESGNYVTEGDEDCLYYNLYTPSLNQSANLDVLVFIHGGAFMFNYGGFWRPNNILDKPLVFITINYRLGPLGFLSTQDDVIPGNYGLKDQQKALTWIKKMVRYFGGNPNSITIQGMSAGGASVQLHCIMPGSAGLFNKAIIQSGSAINNWVLMDGTLEKTKRLADLMGCPSNDSVQLKKCLKSRTGRQIVESVKYFHTFQYNPFSPWAVVVDGNWASNPILPEHPLNLLMKKKIHDVPVLVSFVGGEGLYPASAIYKKEIYLETIDKRWNELIPHILMYNFTVDPKLMDTVSASIRKKYMKNQPVERSTFENLVEACGDRNFLSDMDKAIKLHSAGIDSPMWLFLLSYRGDADWVKVDKFQHTRIGAGHASDIMHTFRKNNDAPITNMLIDIIFSFIKYEHPGLLDQWINVSKNPKDPLDYVTIVNPNEIALSKSQYIGQRTFWDSLPIIENEKLLNITLNF